MYEDIWSKHAVKDLDRIPAAAANALVAAFELYLQDPRSSAHDVHPLQGALKGKLRLRSGNYRLIHTIDHAERTVTVIAVLDRKDAYR